MAEDSPPAQGAVQLYVFSSWHRQGFWSLTRETATKRVIFKDFDTSMDSTRPVTDKIAMVKAVAEAQPGKLDVRDAVAFATTGEVSSSRVLWFGVANNAIVAMLGGLFVLSAWLNTVRVVRHRGCTGPICTSCGYDFRGPVKRECPKCKEE